MRKRYGGSRALWVILGCCIAALISSACSGDAGDMAQGPGPIGVTAAPLSSVSSSAIVGSGDAPTATDVTIRWRAVDSSTPLAGSRFVYADLVNETDTEQTGHLVLVASGLDGRLVQRPLGDFRLAAHATEEVAVRVSALPIQSEKSPSFAAVQAEITRPDGFILRVPTDPLYFHFQGGYREAFFYGPEQVPAKAPRSAPGTNAADVAGRVQEASGAWTDIGSGTTSQVASSASAGPGRQGATSGVLVAAPGAPPLATSVTVKAAPAAAAVYTICAHWRVQFVDSGFGEDYLATSAWQDAPASFGFVYLYQNGTPVWIGNLNVNGCANVSLAPSTSSAIYVTGTNMTWSNGPVIDDYLIQNGARTSEWVSGAFTTGASGGTIQFNFTYNDDVIQVNAVSSAALAAAWRTNQGTIANTHYVVEVHPTECGGASDPSCPYTLSGVVKMGLNSQQGTLMSHWKFMVAHELGHSVQYAFMGIYAYNYTWTAVPTPVCRCDHVADDPYSHTHCLQSRGDIGGAQLEGWAHAFASRVFNLDSQSDGLFVYYKPFLSPYTIPNPTWNPPILVGPLADTKFMSNFCGAAGKGIEIDWMQFFYQVTALTTPNHVAVQDLFYIYRYACTNTWSTACSNQTVSWSSLLNAAQQFYGGTTDARYQRFRDTGTAAGVNW